MSMRDQSAPTAGETVVRGACPHDCPDTCALLVTVRDGRAIRVAGDPDHPSTAGVLCAKVSRYTERTYSPQRLLSPMRRVGRKGEGRFEAVSWDEALDDIAAKLSAIARRDPQRILPYSYAGTMGWVQGEGMGSRLFHRMGASLLDRTICSSPGITALQYTLGGAVGMDVERFVDSKLILIWGSNPITSSVHFWALAQEASRRGAKLIAIDPYRSDTALKCHQHIALMPGTDAALALGMMHVLIEENLLDPDYIDRYTVGFDALAQRAAQWTPARAAAVCGISEAEVRGLALDYGRIGPAAIRLNYGMQRVHGGGNAVRAVACLPALIGAWRHASGGLLLSSSNMVPVTPASHVRPDLIPGGAGKRPRVINMVEIGDALLAADPPVEAVVVYNSNPLAVAPDSEKVIQGFSREDLFTVVIEQFQTDTADFADYVLPATTQLEHFDVHKTYGHWYVLANHPAIAPLGQARSNSDIFRDLAQRMGYSEPALAASDQEIARDAMNWSHPLAGDQAFERMMSQGWIRMQHPDAPFAQGGFPTPSGRCEFWSERLARSGHDPLPDWVPNRESATADPALARRYPLAVISPPARNFLNSTFVNVDSLRAREKSPRCEIHPADAAPRGIAHGDRVRVFNDRGSFGAEASVSDRARPGVVVAWGLWWPKLVEGTRNVNAVTGQALTDMGRGPTFYDRLVEVEPGAAAQASLPATGG